MPPSDSRVHTGTESPTGLVERGETEVGVWGLFDGTDADALITTREGGISVGPYSSLNLALHVGDDPASVLDNRRTALGLIDAALDDLVVAEQVHGCDVAVVGPGDRARGARSTTDAVTATDALVTTEPGLVLAILVADCAPVVLFDPDERVLGCVHSGWRGALGGVLEATIAAMAALGARPDRLLAGIGPCIGASGFEVGREVVEAAERHLGAAEPWARPGREGHWWFDLGGAIEAVLREAGVERIDRMALETGAPGPFFGARAEGTCGRFGLLARIAP